MVWAMKIKELQLLKISLNIFKHQFQHEYVLYKLSYCVSQDGTHAHVFNFSFLENYWIDSA